MRPSVWVLLVACVNAGVITVDPKQYRFKLTQSTTNIQVWTAPATYRVRASDTAVPTDSGSSLSISCAKNELESFQVIIAPTTVATITVSINNFTNLPAGAWVDVGKATFGTASSWAFETTTKFTDETSVVLRGGTVTLSTTLPTVLWITIKVPSSSPAGTTSTNLVLTPTGGSAISIPVSLYVFNFAISTTPHFDTFMMSQPNIEVYSLPEMDAWKKVYLDHRMQAPNPAWPNGLNTNVAWDCATKKLTDVDPDTSTQSCIWANGCTAERYVLGKGNTWRGTVNAPPAEFGQGFSSFSAVNTDRGMPGTLCNVPCTRPSGWAPGTADNYVCGATYEAEWGKYLAALQAYFLSPRNNFYAMEPGSGKVSTKGFWYTQNEPQNDADYKVSAYLCNLRKRYAPQLKVLLSREALPAIAERTDVGACGYDIWMGHVWRYTPQYTLQRQKDFGETSWFYSLDTDNICVSPGKCNNAFAPFISQTGDNGACNPNALNYGPHYRTIPWVAWSNRISGWGYYHDDVIWSITGKLPRPRVSAALLREGFEDYEYLYLANGGSMPQPHTNNPVDITALSLGFAVGVWNSDPSAYHALRHELGRKIEGTRPDFPFLVQPKVFPFGNYNIDFKEDPGTNTPFTFNGASWIPIGWNKFDLAKGFGWNSAYQNLPNVQQPSTVTILQCVDVGAGDTVQSTACYNNYNKPDEFHFSIAPGTYNVVVAIGKGASSCRNDAEYASINNVLFRDHQCSSTDCCGSREYGPFLVTVHPSANGGDLVLTLGNQLGYTFLTYMKIVGVTASGVQDPCAGVVCGTHSTGCTQGTCSCTNGYTGTLCNTPPAPTCRDGIRNQNETGIDCGGPCAVCASYFWQFSPWSACSVTCGGGNYNRTAKCVSNNGTTVADSFCDVHEATTSDVCNVDPCATYTWRSGPWSECSMMCGTGTQTQPVVCISSVGNSSVSNSLCTAPAPASSRDCNTQACTANHWVTGDWSTCSVSCGGGVQTRTVGCADPTEKPLADSACAGVGNVPSNNQTCNTAACVRYQWIKCPPYPCTAQCNGGAGMLGVTYTDVWCETGAGQIADISLCSSANKPITEVATCNPQPCLNYNWMANGNWGPCENGIRTRTFHCHDKDGGSALNADCESHAGPMPLAQLPCVPNGCLSVPPTPMSMSSAERTKFGASFVCALIVSFWFQ